MPQVAVICFLGSYLVAFALEVGKLLGRSRVNRFVTIGFGVAGFAAHTIYLLNRSRQTHLPPLLASTHDWMLVLAWVLVLFYLFLSLTRNDLAVGLFALPVVLLLVASTYFLSHEPNTVMNVERARRNWGMLHASLLVFGIAAGASGFVSGVMYLFQHRRLKTRHGEHTGLKMPSLARLAQANRWSVMLAFLFLTLGFGSGIFLALAPPGGTSTVHLQDPAVVISGLVWLFLAGLFVRLLMQRAPTGRQVAWLTICGCGFLLLTLIGLQVITGNVHSYSSILPSPPERGAGGEGSRISRPLNATRGIGQAAERRHSLARDVSPWIAVMSGARPGGATYRGAHEQNALLWVSPNCEPIVAPVPPLRGSRPLGFRTRCLRPWLNYAAAPPLGFPCAEFNASGRRWWFPSPPAPLPGGEGRIEAQGQRGQPA